MEGGLPTENSFEGRLKELFSLRIITGSEVVKRAIVKELGENETESGWIKEHFSELVESIQRGAYAIYLESEKAAAGSALRDTLMTFAGPNPTAERILDAVVANVHAIDRFFLGLTQGRRARAGSAFEVLVRQLFTVMGYPFTAKPKIDGNPDFVLPSKNYYQRRPLDCIIFTVKRSLRERWRQIVTEGKNARGFFLATIDEKVSSVDIAEMERQKIYLVVPARLKAEIASYNKASHVLTFEQFLLHHVDPARNVWAAAEQ
jgi:hypothetical protein